MCSPARVPFRQFFKIKSLSVLVKCISRPPNTHLWPRVPAPAPAAVDAAGRAFARAIVPLSSLLPLPLVPPLSISLSLLVPRSIHVLRLMTDSWPRKKVCKSAGTRQTEIHGSKCAAIVHTRSEGASGLTETGGGWIVEKERRTDRGSNEQNRAGRERERQRDKREEPGGARW